MKNIILICYWSSGPHQLSILTDGAYSIYSNYGGTIGNILLYGSEIGGLDYSLTGIDDVSTSDFRNYDMVGRVG